MAHRLLDEENACGQTLLHLSARGNSIISEILRLSKKVPTVFYLASEADRAKFARIVYDYAYQERGDAIEDEILADPELLAADDAFRENNLERLERFWLLFDSIYVFYADVQRYLSDLATGVYIQQTVESVLANKDGKQLLAEIVSLYGTMLLLLDMRIPGVVRERMIISYYRYKRASDIEHIDEVSRLCAATGYVHGGPGGKGGRVPEDYPELLFARHTFDPSIVAMIIGRLRADDIYNQLANYPHPAHRSVALATQAAQLYVILFFDPVTLRDEEAVMREIVDKFFPDNWVIAYYLGFCADLSIAWSRYPAAAAAIRNTTATRNVERHKQIYLEKVETCLVDLNHLLTEGVLDEEFLMKKNPQILNVLRDCNVTIRWIMLHTTTKNKKLRELVVRDVSPDRLLLLLLNTAELEFKVKNMVEHLFKEKENRWEMCRREACQRMDELGEYFSGAKELTRVERNEELEAWFKKNSKRIADIDLNDALHAGRKLNHLIKALEEVEAYHQIEASIQVKEFLGDTRRFLRDMMLLVNVEDAIMVKILAIADLSYAWDIMRDYVALMQWRIQRDPGTVIRLRAVFVKLASILQVPLIRILFINSPDLITVSEYYSGELVHFVRTVIEVVPRTMFAHLDAIIDIATSRLVPLEPKILKEDLKNVAQLETRHELARLTHKISVFTLGVLAMETTLVGVVPVNPKELLEDGIRKELVRRIVLALDETMRFRPGKDELFRRLGVLATVLDGYKRSFEYIQDHVQIYGLKIWQEEFSRIVSFCVQMETNLFLRERVEPEDSVYQSSAVPIRLPPPTDRRSANWIGRLTRELLDITSPRTTIYVDLMNTWYDKGGNVVAGIRTMTELAEAVDVFGMRGVDKLLSFMNVASLRSFVAVYRSAMNPDMRAYLASVEETLSPLSTFPAVPNFAKMYGGFVKTLSKWWPLFQETVCPVGHRQVLRRQIARELSFQSKLSSNLLVCSLDTLNAAMMNDIREHYRDASNRPYPAADNPLIPELVEYLEISGRGAPNNKIYMTTEPLEHLATLAFLFVVAQLEQFSYAPNLGTLVNTNKKVPLDGGPFVMGVVTLLKQFHSQHREKFLAMMGQYVRSLLHEEAKDMTSRRRGPGGEYPQAVTHALIFLEHFCEFSDTPRKSIENYVPAYIFDRFER